MTTLTDKLVALRYKVGPFGVLAILEQELDGPGFRQYSMRLLANDVCRFSRDTLSSPPPPEC